MLSYRTSGYSGYGVQYSPFYDNKLAVATAANFGLVGNGRLYILSINGDGSITPDMHFDTQDGLFNVSWSEAHENQVAVSSGDGSVSLFDISRKTYPIAKFQEHQREVFSVNWNMVEKSLFCTSSWDGTIKVWSPNRSQSLLTLSSGKDLTTKASPHMIHQRSVPVSKKPIAENSNKDCVYEASFSPHDANIIISCNSASHCQVWDTRIAHPLQVDFIAHNGLEVLSCDYNKYRPSVIATAGVDKTVRVWDLRMIRSLSQPDSYAPLPSHHATGPSPLNEMIGHEFAVRKCVWSAHQGDTLLTASYDMTSKVWKDTTDHAARFLNKVNHGSSCVKSFDRHREFVIDCDWSLWGDPGWVATTGWDEMVYVWDTKR